MKRSALAMSALVLLVSCNFVHASVLAFDALSYRDGDVKGCNGGTGWASAWRAVPRHSLVTTMALPLTYTFPTGELVDGGVTALSLDYCNSRTYDFDKDVKRKLAQPFSGDVVYASFLFRDDSLAVGKDMCLMWLDSCNGPRFGMVGSRGPDKTDDFGAAAGKSFGSTAFTGDLTLGQTYLIVARISKAVPGAKKGYNKIEMWIDPTIDDEDSPDVTSYASKATVSEFSYIGFADNQRRKDTMYIDEATLGTSWADVVPGLGEPGIPEPATTGLLLAGGLGILWRKRRRGC